jgi:hypothetical protein
MMMPPIPAMIGYVNAGTLRAIGVTSKERSPLLPDVPTIEEAGLPGFVSEQRYGLLAPTGTPRPIIERLNAELRNALAGGLCRRDRAGAGAVGRHRAQARVKGGVATERRAAPTCLAPVGGSSGGADRRRHALVSCPGRVQRGAAERNETRDPAQQARSAAEFLLAIRRVAPGSRVSLRSPGTRDRRTTVTPHPAAHIRCGGESPTAPLGGRASWRDSGTSPPRARSSRARAAAAAPAAPCRSRRGKA